MLTQRNGGWRLCWNERLSLTPKGKVATWLKGARRLLARSSLLAASSGWCQLPPLKRHAHTLREVLWPPRIVVTVTCSLRCSLEQNK